MAAYLTMALTNLPQECGIQIAGVTTGISPGTITKIELKRKIHNTTSYVTIWEKDIATADDFTFTVKDFNVRSRYTYDYAVVPCEGDNETSDVVTNNTKCDFDGIYISDGTSTYICVLNPKINDTQRNRPFAKVDTLGSASPFIIRNGITNYKTGSITGLFLPVPSSGNYTQSTTQTAEARDYKDAVLDFLDNGVTKLIKVYDGRVWYAFTSDEKEVESDADGASEISFNFTTQGAPPTTGVVVV